MKSIGRYLTSFLILGTAIALLVLMTMSRKPPEENDNDNLKQTVSVYLGTEFEGTLEIDVSGLVQPHREIEIASQVSGEVIEKHLDCCAGSYVKEGTLLIQIDSTNYDLAVERLEAEKAQAESSILELDQELENLRETLKLAEKEFDLQKNEYQRKKDAGAALSLSERDEAMRILNSAERSFTEMNNTLRLTETRRTRLQTGIELSSVRLREAQVNQRRCKISAPFDGVIVEDSVEKGDYVSSGKTVIIFEDTSKADVTCNLRFEQLQQIVKYQIPDSRFTRDPMSAYQIPPTAVEISRKRGDGKLVSWSGTLNRFDGIGVDSQTKMIPCRIVVDNPISIEHDQPKALVRGMFVAVRIPLTVFAEEGQSLLLFPTIALRPGNFVWSVVDGRLKQHKVEVLDRKNSDDPDPRKRMVVVRTQTDDLTYGAEIVISPLAQPNPGSEVTIIKKENDSATSTDSNEPDIPDSSSTSTSIKGATEPANARSEKGTIRS